jgi:Uma2 family endonuclease
MTDLSTLLTADDLLALGDIGRCELIRGELVMMSPASANHGVVAARLLLLIGSVVQQHELGATFAAETGFKIESDPDTVRAPDVSFVQKKRLAGGIPARGFFQGPPDLAVEVISPDETKKKVIAKAKMWLRTGSRSTWVVDPIAQTITIYRRQQKPIKLIRSQVLQDEPTLRGFTLSLDQVFKLS